jgi:tRNA(Ile2) C34 agmatinyltransferase TiaS
LRLRLRLHVWLAGGDKSKTKCMRAAGVVVVHVQKDRRAEFKYAGLLQHSAVRAVGQTQEQLLAMGGGGGVINVVGSIVWIE